MANAWFRLYAEFANDPKVQMMPEAMQRRYVMLMCMRCSNVTVTLHETEIAFALRITEAELAETKALFLAKGFIDEDWNLLNWEKRQFASDSSAGRVAKHRAKLKEQSNGDVTLQKRQGNALDTDKNIKNHTCEVSHFDEFWIAYPKKKNRGDAEKAWKALKPNADLLKTILEAVEVAKRGDDWRKENGQFIPYPASWLRAKGWEDEPQMPAQRQKGVVL